MFKNSTVRARLVERVEQGTVLVDQAGVTMNEVVASIRRVTDLMGEITAPSVEHSSGVSKIGQAVTQMDQVTQQNAALVEEMVAAASSLSMQAYDMVGADHVFELSAGASAQQRRPVSAQSSSAEGNTSVSSGLGVDTGPRFEPPKGTVHTAHKSKASTRAAQAKSKPRATTRSQRKANSVAQHQIEHAWRRVVERRVGSANAISRRWAATLCLCLGACGGGGDGTNGTNGTDGTDGTDGAAAPLVLVRTAPEAWGTQCPQGGVRVLAGLDTNGNASLDDAEVASQQYVCNGASGLTWSIVTATNLQAQPNQVYLLDNPAQVVVNLPTTPAVGDTVRVTGVGTGGWRFSQNAGQTILTKALPVRSTPSDSDRMWNAVASSADGAEVVAVEYGGRIHTSTDFGRNFTPREPIRNWFAVSMAADGSKVVAAEYGGLIYTSTDHGVTFTARDSSRLWFSVASSADGTKLVACENGGRIYTSTDSGLTWSARESNRSWQAVASSADGTKLVAVDNALGSIYVSTDSGVTFAPRGLNRNWSSVAVSADGARVVAAERGGRIYISTDSGITFAERDAVRNWFAVASSADGSKLVAVENGGRIYLSNDSGATFVPRDMTTGWFSAASSADGSRLVVVDAGGKVHAFAPDRTTTGVLGTLSAAQFDTLELTYMGSGIFAPIGFASESGSFGTH